MQKILKFLVISALTSTLATAMPALAGEGKLLSSEQDSALITDQAAGSIRVRNHSDGALIISARAASDAVMARPALQMLERGKEAMIYVAPTSDAPVPAGAVIELYADPEGGAVGSPQAGLAEPDLVIAVSDARGG